MKAITTKIIPATNHKPTRVKAQAEGVPCVVVSRDKLINDLLQAGERITEETTHQAAARVLCDRYQWGTDLASGGTHQCGVWVHCFIPFDAKPLVEAARVLATTYPQTTSQSVQVDCHAWACFKSELDKIQF